ARAIRKLIGDAWASLPGWPLIDDADAATTTRSLQRAFPASLAAVAAVEVGEERRAADSGDIRTGRRLLHREVVILATIRARITRRHQHRHPLRRRLLEAAVYRVVEALGR